MKNTNSFFCEAFYLLSVNKKQDFSSQLKKEGLGVNFLMLNSLLIDYSHRPLDVCF